jgi:hypothetical protein
MDARRKVLLWGVAVALTAGVCVAQRFGGRGEGRIGGGTPRTAREVESHSTGTPNWTNHVHFQKDVWTFVRIKYRSGGGRGGRGSRFGYSRSIADGYGDSRWTIDFPDSDLNLSYRVQQMTSLKVDPDGRVLELMDKELFDYPWVYFVEPGGLTFTDEEVPTFRKYLLNGGFAMFDDFWGEAEYDNWYQEMKRVFPEREPVELPMDHPIFNAVFNLSHYPKRKLQVPNVGTGVRSQYDGITWERSDAELVQIKGIFDDKGRLMVIACHNTDNGDGWEREGENDYYFHNFSEKISFPLGINIIFYVMTH